MTQAGDCIWVETNRDRDGILVGHLLVICLDPEEHTKRTITVPIDTLKSKKQDKTTLLEAGDHEFIKKLSYVNYSRARVVSITTIDELIRDGKAKLKPCISPEILDRIREGIRKSDHTPEEVRITYSYYMMRKLPKAKG